MTTRTKIYLAAIAGGLIISAVFFSWAWSEWRAAGIERELKAAKQAAEEAAATARETELRAAGYEQQIKYLEAELSALGQIAAKQDEEIRNHSALANDARRGHDRARARERIESTAAELCGKLAELGHACR